MTRTPARCSRPGLYLLLVLGIGVALATVLATAHLSTYRPTSPIQGPVVQCLQHHHESLTSPGDCPPDDDRAGADTPAP